MKYLIKFNESFLPYYLAVKDISEFCQMYLAYLVDNGFNISNQPGYNSKKNITYTTICFNKTHNRPVVIFSWNEIKDIFIPFFYLLNKDYEILDVVIFNKSESVDRYIEYRPTVEEVLNGEMNFNEIVQINIKVRLDYIMKKQFPPLHHKR